MQNGGFNLDALLDALAERVAEKVRADLRQLGTGNGIRPRLMTVEQAAVYLGRSKEAVAHMVTSGKLPKVQADRRIFWMSWTSIDGLTRTSRDIDTRLQMRLLYSCKSRLRSPHDMARRAGPGRPPKPPRSLRTQRLQVLLTAAEHKALTKYARHLNTTASDLIRAQIRALLSKREG